MDCGDPTSNLTTMGMRYALGFPPNTTIYLSQTNTSCLLGYIFTDGSFWKLRTCTADGAWTAVLDCESRFLALKKF